MDSLSNGVGTGLLVILLGLSWLLALIALGLLWFVARRFLGLLIDLSSGATLLLIAFMQGFGEFCGFLLLRFAALTALFALSL